MRLSFAREVLAVLAVAGVGLYLLLTVRDAVYPPGISTGGEQRVLSCGQYDQAGAVVRTSSYVYLLGDAYLFCLGTSYVSEMRVDGTDYLCSSFSQSSLSHGCHRVSRRERP